MPNQLVAAKVSCSVSLGPAERIRLRSGRTLLERGCLVSQGETEMQIHPANDARQAVCLAGRGLFPTARPSLVAEIFGKMIL